ncbi:MAG: peptide deformylase [Deltaproteobacteria bacterium]|nr:peptide deformylase [Deltaproteobacteria bacterium]
MAVLEFLKYPNPFLKKRALPVETVDGDIKGLIANMVDTMYAAKGIGLAANQVGIDKRVVVLDVPDEENYQRGKNLIALINPEIVSSSGETTYEEGCLSIPGFTAEVRRFSQVKVKGLKGDGNPVEIEAEGLLAITLQHEIDHLNGILFIDRLSRIKRDIIKRKMKKVISGQ